MRRILFFVGALALAVGACAGGGAGGADEQVLDRVAGGRQQPDDATTTTTVAEPLPGALLTSTGVIVPVLGREGDAWRVLTPCAEEVLVTGGEPLGEADVVIDPGHGGEETGAVGANGLVEGHLNWEVAQHTVRALQEAGLDVLLTRTGDYRVTLKTRAEIAVRMGARAFVSIHYNGGPEARSSQPGTEIYYQITDPESRRLAGILYEEVFTDLARYDIGTEWGTARDAGAKFRPNSEGGDYYGILRHGAGVPTVITEGAYLSEPAEAELLARPEVQRDQGLVIARGIQRFLTTEDPGSGFVDPRPRLGPAGPGGGPRGCVDPPL